MTLPTVHYRRSEYLVPWRRRKRNPVHRFILDIPYGLYFSVVPGRLALNELLGTGKAGGGMGTGLTWEPFALSEAEYQAVSDAWRDFDLRAVLKIRERDMPDLSFIYDDDILAIPRHLDYHDGVTCRREVSASADTLSARTFGTVVNTWNLPTTLLRFKNAFTRDLTPT